TILVSVITASGSGSAGVTVTATPSAVANGAQAITTTIDPTDAQGCTYILQVVPGNYDVKIVKTGFLDVNQASSSTVTVGVIAGAAASIGLQFDNAGTFGLTYASNYTPGGVTIPTNLTTSFLSTYGTYVTSTPSTPVKLYPFTAGYQIVAGTYLDPSLPSQGCASVDPSTWLAGPNAAGVAMKAGVRPSAVAAVPGGAAPAAAVAMGVARVSGLSSNPYVSAVETSGASNTGDPGCAVSSSYSLGRVTSGSFLAGLPFGSWTLYTSSTLGGATTPISAANLAVLTGGSVDSSGIVTLDPRQVGP
ncbi:MAG: prepilin-type N-terminal cleavage/methylation protein, partial [Microbacteriaceae bacterium]|nr:prepilin-type N-terminal cleavage/methylation protein [Microbacteriaceae bacterium]